MDSYAVVKTFHFIGIVAWMGSMVAVISLLGASRLVPEVRPTLGGLARKLYLSVQAPGMLIVLATGVIQIVMLVGQDSEYFRTSRWLHNKIMLVLGLMVIDHLLMHRARKASKPEGDEKAELPTAKALKVLGGIGAALLVGVMVLVASGAS